MKEIKGPIPPIEGPAVPVINKKTGKVTHVLITSRNLHQGDGSTFDAKLASMKEGYESLGNTNSTVRAGDANLARKLRGTDKPNRAGKTDTELEHDLARWNKGSKALDNPGPSIRAGLSVEAADALLEEWTHASDLLNAPVQSIPAGSSANPRNKR